MQIAVLVESVNGKGFRASGGEPFNIRVEAETRDGALQKLKEEIDARIKNGAEVVALEVPEANPWMKMAGIFKDDPLFDDWQKAIEEYRDKVDAYR